MKEKFGRPCKELMLKETEEALRSSPQFIITNYLGLSVTDLESLRKRLKKISVQYMVVKNSICKRAFEDLKLSNLVGDVEGSVGLGLLGNNADAASASKTLVDFAKQKNALRIRSGFIGGEYLGADAIKRIATLPPRDILLAMVLQAMKSPIAGFVGALGGALKKLVYVVNAIKDKKEGGKSNG